MKVLVLGGTADGRHLAERLSQLGIKVLYSIAQLMRAPTLSCEIVVGDFSQFGGLASFLKTRQVALVINAASPYAKTISNNAVKAGRQTGIPVWRLVHPAWQPQVDDNWYGYDNDVDLLDQLKGFKRPLLSAGQMSLELLNAIAAMDHIEQVVWRTAAKPKFDVPSPIIWLKATGPFEFSDERKLIEQYQMDVIISQNSGGVSTSAKLDAARELGVPVLLQRRPVVEEAAQNFANLSQLVEAVQSFIAPSSSTQEMQQQ